jgi:hypothetical protein
VDSCGRSRSPQPRHTRSWILILASAHSRHTWNCLGASLCRQKIHSLMKSAARVSPSMPNFDMRSRASHSASFALPLAGFERWPRPASISTLGRTTRPDCHRTYRAYRLW